MLTPERRAYIENLAQELLTKASDRRGPRFPVKVEEVADELEFEVKVARFADTAISGAMSKERRLILVSDKDSRARQAFTVAFELGHAFLHADKAKDVIYRSSASAESPIDDLLAHEANLFASNLLMPEKYVREAWEEDQDPVLLAQTFGVSLDAMKYRLRDLRLLPTS